MSIFDAGSGSVVVVVVLAAAGARWWSGRKLLVFKDDPALPERLVASRRQNVIVFAVAAGALIATSPRSAWWTLPLLVVSRMSAGFPFRKALYRESWPLATYLWFFARVVGSMFGFWIALAMLPVIAANAGPRSWMVALPLGAILFVWNRYSTEVIRYALSSAPITAPAVISRFAALAEKCGDPVPRFERVDLRGGTVANAVALASLRGSTVLFTDALLDRLDEDEAAAICAHELAHLEYFNPARLRRLNWGNHALIAVATAAAVAAPLVSSLAAFAAWFVALVAVLGWRARNRQRNETASDRRAVELTGDADALVRALTKLHVLARVPRRMDPEQERRATHPSLARRIRDIRKAAGLEPAPVDAGACFTAPDGRTTARFEDDRLEWCEGNAATHSLNYAYLSEVRVCAPRSGTTQLVVVEVAGRRWEMTLADGDLTRAQQVLDLVDGRLPDPPPPARKSRNLARWVAVLTAGLALSLGQLMLLLVAAIAAVQPSSSLMGGTALAAMATAAVTLRQTGVAAYSPWIAAVAAALGLLLLLVARSTRDDDGRRRTTLPTAVFEVLVVLAMVPIALGGMNVVRLHDSAQSNPAALVLLMALGGNLAFRRRRIARYAALAAVLVAAVVAFIGSTTFLDRFADDPFLVHGEPIAVTTVGTPAAGEFSVPFFVSELRLSPSGRHVIMVPATEADDGEATTFRVGAAGGTLAPITAEDVVFVDEDHVLIAQAERDGITLRQATVDPLADVWQQHVPNLRDARLSYRAETNRWRLLGRDDAQRIVRAEGVLGTAGVQETRWPAPEEGGAIDVIAAAGDRALVSETRFEAGPLHRSRLLWRWAWLLQPPQRESRFWTIGRRGRDDLAVTRLGTRCVDRVLGDDRLVCGVFDGSDTRFVAIDPATGRAVPVGSLRGRFELYHPTSPAWLSGWADSRPIALRLSTREALRPAADPLHRVTQITAADHVAGTVSFDGTRSLVRLYAID